MTPDEILEAQAKARALAFSALAGLIAALVGLLALVVSWSTFVQPETQAVFRATAAITGVMSGGLLAVAGAFAWLSGMFFARQETNKVKQAIQSGGTHATARGAKG